MKKTLTTYQVANELLADEYASWTRSGALALAEYFEECEEDCGIELELDVVATRCDFAEHESLEEWARGFFWADQLAELLEDSDDKEETLRDYILDHGTLIEFDGGIIVSTF